MFLIFFDLTLLTSNSAVKKYRWRYCEKYNVPQIIFSWIDPQTIHRNYFPNMFNAIGTANKRFPMGFRYGTDMIEVLINKVTIWNIECVVLVSPVFNTHRSPFFFYQCKGNEIISSAFCVFRSVRIKLSDINTFSASLLSYCQGFADDNFFHEVHLAHLHYISSYCPAFPSPGSNYFKLKALFYCLIWKFLWRLVTLGLSYIFQIGSRYSLPRIAQLQMSTPMHFIINAGRTVKVSLLNIYLLTESSNNLKRDAKTSRLAIWVAISPERLSVTVNNYCRWTGILVFDFYLYNAHRFSN